MNQQLDIALAEVSRAADERHALTMECLQLLTSLIRMMQSQDADLHGLVNHLRALPATNGGRLQPQQYGHVAAAPQPYAAPYAAPQPGGMNGADYLGEAKQDGLAALDKLRTAMSRAAQENQGVGPAPAYDNGDYYGVGAQPYRNGSK
jgi:hypothetical protein